MGNFAWLLIVPILAVLVTVHEFGHFFAARFFGVEVEEFGIGLPPRIIGRRWKGTLWSLNAIPLGGFARMKDENTSGAAPDSFQTKPAYARAIILIAGIVFNFIFAGILFAIIFTVHGVATGEQRLTTNRVDANSPAQNAGWQPGDQIVRVGGVAVKSQDEFQNALAASTGKPVQVDILRGGQVIPTTFTPPAERVVVGGVNASSPAHDAGWQAGDQIVRLNGQAVQTRAELTRAIEAAAGQPIPIDILRDGQTISTTITPRRNPPSGQGPLGITIDTRLATSTGLSIKVADINAREPIWRAIPDGFGETARGIGDTYAGLTRLVRGRQPGGVENLTGPVGIAQVVGEVVQQATIPVWVVILNITAFISINLGILNLLPIPALDGGRLLFVLIEWVRRGKRVPAEREGMVHLIGMAVLLTIFVLVAFLDIQRILDGRSILPR